MLFKDVQGQIHGYSNKSTVQLYLTIFPKNDSSAKILYLCADPMHIFQHHRKRLYDHICLLFSIFLNGVKTTQSQMLLLLELANLKHQI